MTAWCAHVTVTPEANRIAVFSKGIWKGLKGAMAVGGQHLPISKVLFSLLWKNAQKNEKKNKTSDRINNTIPQRSPEVTLRVWRPWRLPSREMSRHHWALERMMLMRPIVSSVTLNRLNHLTRPVVRSIALIELVKGQGLFSTRW